MLTIHGGVEVILEVLLMTGRRTIDEEVYTAQQDWSKEAHGQNL
jgi:hypothetical protein